MNMHTIEGQWDQLKGIIKKTWGKLTDDDLKSIEGSRDILCGKLMTAYDVSKAEAQRRVDEMYQSIQRETLQ